MAKYILCLDCTKAWRADAQAERQRVALGTELDSGATERYVRGKAKHPMLCDGTCGGALPAGVECCAITVEPPGHKIQPWESEFIEAEPPG